MKHDHRTDVTLPGTWDSLWSERNTLAEWDYLSHLIYSEILPSCRRVPGVVLEVGSGSGRISARLGSQGVKFCQLDNSLPALRLSRQHWGKESWMIGGDIRHLPLQNGAIQTVWSSGVLEHFQSEGLVAALRELARITSPSGQIISLVPYARCLPYRCAKWVMECSGLWPYGREEPLLTMRTPSEAAGLIIEREYTIAFSALGIQNLQFLPFISGLGRSINRVSCRLYDAGLLSIYDRWSSRLFGGYLLVSIARKP